jgi:hypothetical protein
MEESMSRPYKDLTGKKFGRWTVLKLHSESPTKWLCKCKCGNKRIVKAGNLTRKNNASLSCGCLMKELASKRFITHGCSRSKNKEIHSTYRTWHDMKQRCLNKKNKRYYLYGDRGINICKRWQNSFNNFFKDMGLKPKGMTIERINNNKGYSKKNCKWATYKEQCRNFRHNRNITWNNKTQCMTAWAEELKIPMYILKNRLNNGWSMKKITKTSIQNKYKNKRFPRPIKRFPR